MTFNSAAALSVFLFSQAAFAIPAAKRIGEESFLRSLHSISVPPGTHNFEPLEEEAVEQGGDDGAELLLQRIAQRLTGGGSASLPELDPFFYRTPLWPKGELGWSGLPSKRTSNWFSLRQREPPSLPEFLMPLKMPINVQRQRLWRSLYRGRR